MDGRAESVEWVRSTATAHLGKQRARRRFVRAASISLATLVAMGALVRLVAPRYVEHRVRAALARSGFPEAEFEVARVSLGAIELTAVDLGPTSGVTVERAQLSFDLADLRAGRVDTITLRGGTLHPRHLASHLGARRDRPRRPSRRSRLPFARGVIEDGRVLVAGRALPVAGEVVPTADGGVELELGSLIGGAAAELRATLSRGPGGDWQARGTAAAHRPDRGDHLRAELRYSGGALSASAELERAELKLPVSGRPARAKDLRASAHLELVGERVTRAELEASAASAERAGSSLRGVRLELSATGTASGDAFDLELSGALEADSARRGAARARGLRARLHGRGGGDRHGLERGDGTLELRARSLRPAGTELALRGVRVHLPVALGARALAGSASAAGVWWQDRRLGSARGDWSWRRGRLKLDARARLAGDTFGHARAQLRRSRGGALRIAGAELEAFGGTLRARPFSIRRGQKRASLVLAATGLDLARLVPRISRGRADGRGRIGGELMATLGWAGRPELRIDRAHLRAAGSGRITIRDRAVIARLVAATGREPLRDLGERLAAALGDFAFFDLELDLPPRAAAPSRLLRLHLRGRGVKVQQELDLTVNLRGLGRVAERALDLWLAGEPPLSQLGAST